MKLKSLGFLAGVALLLALPVSGQESRARLSGTVMDPQRAAIPGARIEAKNVDTGVVTTSETNAQGIYMVPALNPGNYTVTAGSNGFKSMVRDKVELRVADVKELDFTLELGSTTESITVASDAALLDVATSSNGTTINQELVANTPLLGRNPFMLMMLANGTSNTVGGSSSSSRPFDNGGMDGFSVNGGPSATNEYLLDGAPNTATEGIAGGASNLAFVPPPDAVGEFKMQTNLYDAEYGRTGGGVVNVSLKSGTNALHGSAYHYLRNEAFNANQLAANAAGQKLAMFRWNQPGASISGPVFIPKVYDGRNKTFFMYSWEAIRSQTPRPTNMIVPTARELTGDYSATLYSGSPIAIYDPLTTVLGADGKYTRTPFANSQIPATRLDPVFQNMVKLGYFPKPTLLNTARGVTNLVIAPNPTKDSYDAHTIRFDQVVGANDKLYVTLTRGVRNEVGGLGGGLAMWKALGHPEAASTYAHYRKNYGATVNYTKILSPTFTSTTKVGFTRHDASIIPFSVGFDPTVLGISSSLVSQMPGKSMPNLTFSNYTGFAIGGAAFGGGTINKSYTYSFGQTFNKVLGIHSIKFGGEARSMLNNRAANNLFGTLAFNTNFTQRDPNNADSASGDAFAAFQLGYPWTTNFTYQNQPAWNNRYYQGFLQDDIRVSKALTLNLGVRWDYESPQTDRYNRIVIGFDTTSVSKLGGTVPVTGGLVLGDQNSRFAYKRDLNNWQPRIGFAYKAGEKAVIRGGWGISYVPTADFPSTNGFTASSGTGTAAGSSASVGSLGYVPTTLANGLGILSNPYPDGINVPTGRTLGLLTSAGQAISYVYPGRTIPYVHSFSLGVQYQLPFRSVFEASYVGSRSRELQTSKNVNTIDAATFLAQGSALGAGVTNPYAGLLPYSGLNGKTITKLQSLLPYSQFSSVTESGRPIGTSSYNSLQVRLEKRFSSGFTGLMTYTFAKNMNRTGYRNANFDQVGNLMRVIDTNDQPHVLNLSSTYQIPLFKNAKPLLRTAFGGWTVAGTAVFQSGVMYSFSGLNSTGVNPTLANPTRDRMFNTCYLDVNGARKNCASADEQAAWIQLPTYAGNTLTGTSPRFTGLRTDRPMQMNLSLFKAFQIKEQTKLEFRAESFNTTNTPWIPAANTTITNSNFGKIVNPPSQSNDPRSVQFALRLTF